MKEYYEYKIEQINNELSLLEPFVGTLPEEENESIIKLDEQYFNYDDLLSEVKSEINERLLDDNNNVVIRGLNELQESNKNSENNILLILCLSLDKAGMICYHNATLLNYHIINKMTNCQMSYCIVCPIRILSN